VKKYIIVVESGADLSREMIQKHDIRVAQMSVEIDGRDYPDESVSMEELTGYYDRTGKVPKTAGVNPPQYKEIFDKIKNEDPDTIILHLCYSAVLSVGYQSSMIADDKTMTIHHIDTKNVSIGQALIVMKVVDIIEKQPEIEPEELNAMIESIVARTRFSFVPGNLDYLRAGGRVSNAQYLGAKLLRIKPLIEVIDGFMLSTRKYLGSAKMIVRKMLSDYFEKFTLDKDCVFFVYACAIDDAIKESMERQATAAGIKRFVWLKTGGVITSHSGPGGVGIAGMEAL
jgi:DegV family protein with EDD domain